MIEMHHNSNFEEDIYMRNQIPRPCKEITQDVVKKFTQDNFFLHRCQE